MVTSIQKALSSINASMAQLDKPEVISALEAII
jgi:hypothetical protein